MLIVARLPLIWCKELNDDDLSCIGKGTVRQDALHRFAELEILRATCWLPGYAELAMKVDAGVVVERPLFQMIEVLLPLLLLCP